MQNKCRNVQTSEDRGDIDLPMEGQIRSQRAWTGRQSLEFCKLNDCVQVGCLAPTESLYRFAGAPILDSPVIMTRPNIVRYSIYPTREAAKENEMGYPL